ncbi:hypothetical protein V2J09_011214 [Rumex salicifolius]
MEVCLKANPPPLPSNSSTRSTNSALTNLVEAKMVDFSSVAKIKDPLVAKASGRLITSEGELREQYDEFCRDPDIMSWLEDASYFAAVDDTIDSFSWYQWPSPLKDRHLVALAQIYERMREYINTFIAQQFLFQRQWQRVRDYARKKGVKIMGDMPIYVGYHSADVWDNRSQFLLNRKGYPLLVSGVPPDAFSETGQLWGSPLYDWKAMKQDGFSWWIILSLLMLKLLKAKAKKHTKMHQETKSSIVNYLLIKVNILMIHCSI